MRIPRIYCINKLAEDAEVVLGAKASKHILQVLRLQLGSSLVLFNGAGGEYNAQLFAIDKQRAVVKVNKFINRNIESPLKIYLGQAISRGEKMDYTIQKAVELGVYKITPLFTERCNVKLTGERLQKRLQHWQAIAISACEQCGRNHIPVIEHAQELRAWVAQCKTDIALTLYHRATKTLTDLSQSPPVTVALLIGSEGGLSEQEMQFAQQYKFISMHLGPRILRTETAALATISILQGKWGDFA